MVNPSAAGGQRKLYGALVTYRRPAELSLMLSRLANQDRPLDSLVVIDNAPSRQSEEAVRAYAAKGHPIQYEAQPENLGPAGGFARGMQRALDVAGDDDWIVLLDDDNPPTAPTVLGELAKFGETMLERNPGTGAVGLMGARFDWRRARLVRVPDDELVGPVRIDYIGNNKFPLYRASAIRAVGLLRREIFFGFEELEYGLRLAASGYELYAPGPRWLESRRRRGKLGLSGRPALGLSELHWRRYYALRNLIFILRSFGRPGLAVRVTLVRGFGKPLASLLWSPEKSWQHLQLNWKACRDGWTGRMGRTLDPSAWLADKLRLEQSNA
jgi:glycosyltransferase involved in cell wall biosynthesis